jgi:ribonuclease P protein component
MSHEAHVPAEQPCPRPPSRLSRAHGDAGRPGGDSRASIARSQDAVGLITLSKRSDFLAANAGRRAPMPGFVLLVRPRDDADPVMRIGYTVTKKIGGAVVRNRMKRRFRALAREVLPISGVRGADHVLIGRAGGIERAFDALRHDLVKALAKVAR